MGHFHRLARSASAIASVNTRTTLATRPWREALLWLVFLGPFFFVSYGFANWAASRRADVGAVVFAWERKIPFVDWTIVPYWSIDFLYAASVFVCASRRELRGHVQRLLGAQLICVTCFLLVPLRFSFERPDSNGIYGLMFDVLASFDAPFNQAPSLHIALSVILWALYIRHTPPRWRVLVHGWFALIAVSVLTTWQHHFIDLPTGAWVGLFCTWLFPYRARAPYRNFAVTRDRRRLVLAGRYAAAGIALAGLSLMVGGWALWLLWVSGSLLLVASAYAAIGVEAFQKDHTGSLSPAVRWLLAPYLLAAWLNSRWWTRSLPAADAVEPGLWLGRIPTRRELSDSGLKSVVDLTAEFGVPAVEGHYALVPNLDLVSPCASHLTECAAAIDGAMLKPPVLVCCALGFSRSAVAVAAWLIASGRVQSAEDAVEWIRAARPAVVFDESHVLALQAFAETQRVGAGSSA